MFVHKLFGLIALLLITGLMVLVLSRSGDEGRDKIVSPHEQSLTPKALRSPEQLTERSPGVTAENNREEASSPRLPSSLPQGPATGEKPTEQQPLITVEDGRLSVQVQNRPLKWVLAQISEKSGVFISTENIGNVRISVQLQDSPLDQGLRHILRGQDTFFFYGTEEGEYGNASLQAVWVYTKGTGHNILPVPRTAWASTREVELSLTDPDPEERARAVEVLVERKGKQALDIVLQVLKDQDEKVRYRALFKALNAGLALPADTLQTLLQSDSSPVVRFLALDALAERPGADRQNVKAVAELALNDPNPQVQDQAREILSQLEAAAQPPDPSQPVQEQGGADSQ